jgi:hypothetical protein
MAAYVVEVVLKSERSLSSHRVSRPIPITMAPVENEGEVLQLRKSTHKLDVLLEIVSELVVDAFSHGQVTYSDESMSKCDSYFITETVV